MVVCVSDTTGSCMESSLVEKSGKRRCTLWHCNNPTSVLPLWETFLLPLFMYHGVQAAQHVNMSHEFGLKV